jgi:hypothetical protein
MTRFGLLTAAAVALLALSLAPLAGAADIALRYKMAANQALTYDCATHGEGTIEAMGRTDPLTMSATFTYTMTCTAKDATGNMTLVHRVLSPVVEATWGDQALPVSLDIPVVTTVISPTGKVLKTTVQRPQPAADAGAGGLLGGLGGGLMGDAAFDVGQFFGELHGPGFPAKAVHPGNRWKDAVRLTTQAGEPMVLNYVTRFLDYATLGGTKCARLQTDFDLPLALSLQGGPLFNLSGNQKGSQVAYFDYTAGRMVRYDGTTDTAMTMATPQLFGGAGGNQVAAVMNLRSVTSVVLQP